MKFGLRLAIASLLCVPSIQAATVSHAPWGKDASGAEVELYTIATKNAEAKITTYGAHIVSLRVPNRKGEMGNVVLGRDNLQFYMSGMGAFMGATIGRYANRIDHGQFTLDGQTYHIPTGMGGIALHGGTAGFHTKVWSAKKIRDGVEMSLVSPDGDMGFPGTLKLAVRFTLVEIHGDPALKIQYAATTSKPTVVNFTNHAFFNLGDDSAIPVFGDVARIDADSYTPFDARLIPTGAIAPVVDTPFDFRTAHAIAETIPERGYDHNFVLRAPSLGAPSVEIDDPISGRTIQVYTTEPGMQFYVPRFPAPPASPAGLTAAPRRPSIAAFCLETQHFPDSPNHSNFPTTELRPGQKFQSTTIYLFGIMRGAAAKQ